ncbi:serpin-ZX-like [Rhododendron vialii]|uniref:serpin-ZX-like n=1 Tax=Rhododendron vialii TaxID=182163 RepID=UPI00265F12D5|nr:serpin-ZX-like [Rhododendron vialii]
MAPEKKKKGSAGNTTPRPSKRKKVPSAKKLPLPHPMSATPNPELTNSRTNYSTAIAKQLLLEQVKKGTNENFALSPVSIDVVLTMVAAGSRGPTLEHIDGIKSIASAMMAAAVCGGGEGSDGPVLSMVNGVWVDERFTLVDSYKEEILTAEEVVKKANLWAEDASKGLITNLLQLGSLSPYTAIILANGIYFKGIWTHERRFDASLTEEGNFYLLTGDTISIPFMTSRRERYHYRSFDGFKVLKIPYQSAKLDRKFFMYFFLPHEKFGLQNLLEELCSDSGSSKQDYYNLSEESLDQVWIPKFEFSYGFDVSLTMKEMGMMFPCLENPEDLSEMIKIPKGIPFFPSVMIQKVVITVDEKGTEAAVVTRKQLPVMAARCPPPKPSFIADHPFMFMIKEEMSGLVFFKGAVLNPKA